ncbi:MAG: transposase, partial [Candidatus Aenigmarchaeota archaeon]|nr:transposase [Candidatus Aenigmarchaeota archaeon]
MAFIKSFKSQQWLLPPSIEELIPSDHVCFLIESLVDSIDFSPFEIKYSGAGHPAYHPKVILKPMLMGVMDNIRSSRKIARSIKENIVYMHLAEKLTPDFRTISDFRKNNPDLVKKLFKHTVILAKQEGMLNMSCFATDGTKIKANSSDRKVLNKNELKFLMGFIDNELEKWSKQDSLEDDFFQKIRGSDELPEKNKRKMKKIVEHYIKTGKEEGIKFKRKTKKTLEKVQKEHNDNKELDKVSMTDT